MARMAPAANRMTIVRTKVAKSEVTFSTPTLAKIAVSAAKAADSTAQVCQAVQMLFIAVSEWFESDVWRPAGSAIRRPESTRSCHSWSVPRYGRNAQIAAVPEVLRGPAPPEVADLELRDSWRPLC